MKQNAFITGSRAYGNPVQSSDVDLVILCSRDTENLLKAFSDGKTAAIRFGSLNIITCCSELQFQSWKAATEMLEKQSIVTGNPVCKADAIKAIDTQLLENGVIICDAPSSSSVQTKYNTLGSKDNV